MQTGDWSAKQFQTKIEGGKMKYVFQFQIFGKEMKAEIEAPNEAEAREILLRKVREQVKVTAVTPSTTDREAKKVEDLFKKMGIWP